VNVILHCPYANTEASGDLRIRQPGGDEPRDLQLARGEHGESGTRHCAAPRAHGPVLLGDVKMMVLPRAPRGVDGLLGLPAF